MIYTLKILIVEKYFLRPQTVIIINYLNSEDLALQRYCQVMATRYCLQAKVQMALLSFISSLSSGELTLVTNLLMVKRVTVIREPQRVSLAMVDLLHMKLRHRIYWCVDTRGSRMESGFCNWMGPTWIGS